MPQLSQFIIRLNSTDYQPLTRVVLDTTRRLPTSPQFFTKLFLGPSFWEIGASGRTEEKSPSAWNWFLLNDFDNLIIQLLQSFDVMAVKKIPLPRLSIYNEELKHLMNTADKKSNTPFTLLAPVLQQALFNWVWWFVPFTV